MKRKFIFLIYMMLALSFASYSQTATIESVSPAEYAVGDVLTVPVGVTGFTDVAAVTLGIGFDDQVLTYIGFNSILPGALCNTTNLNGPQVSFAWSSLTTLTLDPGTLLTMDFVYLGGTCDLTFNPTDCDVVQLVGNTLNPLDVTYTDGEVPQTVDGAGVIIGSVGGAVIGDAVEVPLTFVDFGNNIGAVTLYIAFDSDNLTFIEAEGFGPLSGLLYNVTDNVITVAWNNANNTLPIDGESVVLVFNFNGPTAADITFEPDCHIMATGLENPLPVIYLNGGVMPISGSGTASIETTEAFAGNTHVPVFVNFDGFLENIASLTFKIAYDSDKLTFEEAVGSGDLLNILYYSDNEMIYVSWSSVTGKDLNDDDIALFFTYLGGGDAPLTFAAGTEVATNSAVIINTDYTNGGIIQGDSPFTVSLDMVSAFPNNQVTNTISFDGFPSVVGSMTLYVVYDETKMTLQDVEGTNDLSNILWFDESNGKEGDPIVPRVKITWSGTGGIDPDGSTILLTFMYLGGGATPLVFGPGCVISDTEADPFDVSYYDGGVNQCEDAIIDVQPVDDYVCFGQAFTFTVISANATSYQWQYYNGTSWQNVPVAQVPSAVTNELTYTVSNPEELWLDGAKFRCLLQCGTVYSDEVTLYLDDATVTVQPVDTWVNEGEVASFNLTATCAATYQWYYRETPLGDWVEIVGATSNQLTTDPVEASWSGSDVYCLIQPGDVESDVVQLYVNPKIDLKVFLEGPFNTVTGVMNTYLFANNLIPLTDPYGGTETVTSIPENVVDWVYVELRDADLPQNAVASTTKWQGPLFLLNDGSIVDLDGSSLKSCSGEITIDFGLYVVVRHRNHLAVISSNHMISSDGVLYSYNFTDNLNKVYLGPLGNNGYKLIPGATVYGLITGDADGNGSIALSDRTLYRNNSGLSGYLGTDFNLDKDVSVADFNKWRINSGFSSMVP